MAKMTKEEKLQQIELKKQEKEMKKQEKQLKKAAKKQKDIVASEESEIIEEKTEEIVEEVPKKKKHKGMTVLGIILVILQFAASAAFGYLVYSSGVLPVNYMIVVLAALILLLLISILFVTRKGGFFKFLGIIIALIVTVILAFLCLSLFSADSLVAEVTGEKYKQDTMVAVVRVDDKAEDVKDLKGYDFGISTADNKTLVSETESNIADALGTTLKPMEYDSAVEEAQALINGDIDVAVYNEAATSLIADCIEGYEDSVKTVYSYDIKSETGLVPGKNATVEEPFNVLVSVTDSNNSLITSVVSEVTMLLTVNPDTNQILITSIPKYLLIDMNDSDKDRISDTGLYGVDTTVKTVEKLLDTNINFYLRTDFVKLADVVDALGGIDVKSDYEFTCYNGGFPITEGTNHLNGEEMVGYVRETEAFKTSYVQQEKNQEAVLKAIINECTLENVGTNALSFVNSAENAVITNMPKRQLMTIVKTIIEKGAKWEKEKQTIAGTSDISNLYSTGSITVDITAPDEDSVNVCANNVKAYLGIDGALYEQQEEIEDTGMGYTDVSTTDWYYQFVKYVSDNGYMTGETERLFDPNGTMTRVQAVIILNAIAGSPEAQTANIFSDVDESQWYADFIDWAGENGIAEGNADGTFEPNAEITREELVKMFMNFCVYMKQDVAASGDISAYADYSDVSSDCVDAFSWAIENGIVSGTDQNMLNPAGTTSRAEMAVMINNLMTKILK